MSKLVINLTAIARQRDFSKADEKQKTRLEIRRSGIEIGSIWVDEVIPEWTKLSIRIEEE